MATGDITRRALMAPLLQSAIVSCVMAQDNDALNGVAGLDRAVVLPGKTYLRGWAGYGAPPRTSRPAGRNAPVPPSPPVRPDPNVKWSREAGPGPVVFANDSTLITTALFRKPGRYLLRLTARDGRNTASSTLTVLVENPPPPHQLGAVYTKRFQINRPFWRARAKALTATWIPHSIDQINRTDIPVGEGGIDNFVEAAKALRDQPHGLHAGYVFSNAWVHQTVESICIALMIDPEGDPEILAAQEPDGYLQTAFTLNRQGRNGAIVQSKSFQHWDPAHRGDHEGYVAGYFLESAINHYPMSDNPLDAHVARCRWHVCPCCVGNIPRTLLMLPTWTYAKAPRGIYVNLYAGGTIELEDVGGVGVVMVQETDYPWNGKIAITVTPKAPKRFSLHLRIPNRSVSELYKSSPPADGLVSLAVNGASEKPRIANGYAVVTRTWKAGDKVELVLPRLRQRIKASDRIEATRNRIALRYGP